MLQTYLLVDNAVHILGLLHDEKHYVREIGLKLIKYLKITQKAEFFGEVLALVDDKVVSVRKGAARALIASSPFYTNAQLERFFPAVLRLLEDKSSSLLYTSLKHLRKVECPLGTN